MYIKKNSTIANLLMEKPGNWFIIAKIWETYLDNKKMLRKGPVTSLKITRWDSFQFLLAQTWFLHKRKIDSKWVFPNN